jgi:phage tail sheath gpL-like
MASENITFDNIGSGIRKPGRYTEFNTSLAVRSLPSNAQKMVIIAQMTASGSATVETPYRIFSEEDAVLYAGLGSHGHLCCRAALKANPRVKLWLILMVDASGTPAEGTITVSGIASSTGSFEIWIGNERVEVTVTSGDAVNDIASAVDAAINEKEHNMPVTAAVATAVVTLTARNDGLLGNSIPISFKNNNVGTTDFSVVQPASGATDPSIANCLTAIFPGDYDIIFAANNDATNLALLKAHLVSRIAPVEDRPAMGYFGYTGVQATLETLAGTTLNSEWMSVAYHKYTKTTEIGHSLDYEIGAAYAAVVAGEEDPARPLNTLVLTGIAPAALAQRLSRSQQESCLENGVTPLEVQAGEEVGIVRAITTYTLDANSIPDVSMLDITTPRTLFYVKLAIETRQAQRFPRAKKSTKTPARVKTQILNVLGQLEQLEIVEEVEANKDGVICESDLQDANRINAKIPVDVVNGLHIIANRIDLLL